MHVYEKIGLIRQRIECACQKVGRNPNEVKLLLATKTVSPEKIIEAFWADETLIGENKVQELKQKYNKLKAFPHETHFIGHLQSNKAKEVVKYVSCIQSIDRMSLVKKLHKYLEKEDRRLAVLLQVNTSAEESKFGLHPKAALQFAKEMAGFPLLKVKGLMTIGLFSSESEKVRKCFRVMREVRDEISGHNLPGIEMKELSMGMSNDLEIAIEEGATIVRVGTAVFGERGFPDSYYWNEGT